LGGQNPEHRTNRFTEPPPSPSASSSGASEGRRSVSFPLGCPLPMSVRAIIPFALAFVANVVTNLVWRYVSLSWVKMIHGTSDIYFDFAVQILLPFTTYLVVLYSMAVFVQWQRVLRALVLCCVSVAAMWFTCMVAFVLQLVVDYGAR
jgi:hypothetical protein